MSLSGWPKRILAWHWVYIYEYSLWFQLQMWRFNQMYKIMYLSVCVRRVNPSGSATSYGFLWGNKCKQCEEISVHVSELER